MSDRMYDASPEYASENFAVENFVLVAQSADPRKLLTKRNYVDSQLSYDNVLLYNFFEVRIDSLEELYMLCVRMLDKPRCCFVRARLKDENIRFRVRRNYKAEDATLILESFNWFALDIDWSDQESSGDLVTDANIVLLALPSCFNRVECFVVASASYGIKPGIRMRMFFWSRNAISNQDLKTLLDGCKHFCDPAIFNPIQPIYTAKPIFVGLNDPVSCRIASIIPLGIFSSVVEIIPRSEHYYGAAEKWYTKRKALKGIENSIIRISNLHAGQRHDELFKESCFIGKMVGQGHIDRSDALQMILEACDTWTGRRKVKKDTETINSGFNTGIRSMEKGAWK